MSVKVSVIIPVYNSESYIRQCLESVISQSLKDIEIICVDDASSDNSQKILEEYKNKDLRIAVIFNDSNKHAGMCRNAGLEIATGEYVLFLDSDDWLLPDSLERVYCKASQHSADVLKCKAVDYNNMTGEITESYFNSLKSVPSFLFDKNLKFSIFYPLFCKINVAPWGGVYKRLFLQENNINFNDLLCVNDRSFFWESLIKADRIIFTNEKLVSYRTNISTSLVGNRIKNFFCHFESYKIIYDLTCNLKRRICRTVMNAEMQDIANWYEVASFTSLKNNIKNDIINFTNRMDKSPWNGVITHTKWYRKIK